MSTVEATFPDDGEASAVEGLLLEFRENPPGPGDKTLSKSLSRCHTLINSLKYSGKRKHWFCERATPLAIEVSTFLLRLHAYKGGGDWRAQLADVLRGCSDCVAGYLAARLRSDDSYLKVYSPQSLAGFNSNVDKWEVETIVASLKGSRSALNDSIDQAPSAVVYHALANHRVTLNTDVQSLFAECTPKEVFTDWPKRAPPGLLLLLASQNSAVRSWAERQVEQHVEEFDILPRGGPHHIVLSALARRLQSLDKISAASRPSTASPEALDLSTCLSPPQLWRAFPNVIRLTAPKDIAPLKNLLGNLNLCQIVVRHVNDDAEHFLYVLECFCLLITKYTADLWVGESSEFPQVKVDAIRDNRMFDQALAKDAQAALQWCLPYISSVWTSTNLPDALAKMLSLLSEDLQHQRRDIRCRIAAAESLGNILDKAYSPGPEGLEKDARQWQTLIARVNAQAKAICAIAFPLRSKDDTTSWNNTRSSVRESIRMALAADGQRATILVHKLSSIKRAGNKALRSDLGKYPFIAHDGLWTQAYSALAGLKDDADAAEILLRALAASSHLDTLLPNVYVVSSKTDDLPAAYKSEMKAYHKFLEATRSEFSAFLDRQSSRTLEALMQQELAAEALVTLVFSPSKALHDGAQEVVSQVYDVDGRAECLQALFENHPSAAFSGTHKALTAALAAISKNPTAGWLEASTLSRQVVLCLTDILEALCGKPRGLLYQPNYEGEASVMDLWNAMTDVSAAIFASTPTWAQNVPDPAILTVWMRDALIFGREMVSKYNILHDSASSTLQEASQHASPSKGRGRTTVGKQMISKLGELLTEVTKWLKLTDEELLHQSVELVKCMLENFEVAGSQPDKSIIDKLKAYTDPNRKLDLNREQRDGLLEALAPWLPDEETANETEDTTPIPPPQFGKSKASDREKIKDKGKGKQIAVSEESDSDGIEYIESKPAPPKPKPKPATEKPLPKSDAFAALLSGKKKEKIHLDLTKKPALPSSKPATRIGEMRKEHKASRQQLERPVLMPPRPPATIPGKEARPLPTRKSRAESDDSDSSDEEASKGLVGILDIQAKAKQVPEPSVKLPEVQIKPPERRQIVVMDDGLGGRNALRARQERKDDSRRMQMRLKPDLSPLHKLILSWDYGHTGDDPPDIASRQLRAVPDSFQSYENYRDVFFPLLALECWSQLQKSKEEADKVEKSSWTLVQRGFVDQWLDLTVTLDSPPVRGWYLAETDIVVLQPRGANGGFILAKTQSYKQNKAGSVATIRCIPISSNHDLSVGTHWTLWKVLSLSTVHREYAALLGAQYYDLFDEIIRPRAVELPYIPRDRLLAATKTFNVNEPQAQAILGSFQMEGFSLIQGPPGTGKTSTICGLAGHFLATRTSAAVPLRPGETARAVKQKLLICAPSNAAIDEVAKRISDGIRDANGKLFTPNVVRIGQDQSMNVSVKHLSLDYLVERKMNSRPNQPKDITSLGDEISRIQEELQTLHAQRRSKIDAINAGPTSGEVRDRLDSEIKSMNSKRANLNRQLNEARDRQTDVYRGQDAAKRGFRREVLREADIICSTLSGSGHESLDEFDFETVIIDEAAQSIEISSLIPLKYRCKRCILVGDPKQLAPTVLSMKASKFNYEQSLFARIEKRRAESVYLLSIQYRMHPSISILPSSIFYDGRLKDGPDMDVKTAQPWHKDAMLPPYRFFNVVNGLESSNKNSYQNSGEVNVAIALYRRITRQFSTNGELDGRIGIVTMYRGQLLELRQKFESQFGKNITKVIDFNTVDGFQGQEKAIIILSCVRAGPGVTSIGFLADMRRMNVALTRSKSSLYILGHAPTLERSNHVWQRIVKDARDRDCFIDASPKTFDTVLAVSAAPIRTQPPPSTAAVELTKPSKAPKRSLSNVSMEPQESEQLPPSAKRLKEAMVKEPESSALNQAGDPIPVTSTSNASATTAPAPSTAVPSAKPRPPRPKADAASSLFIPSKKRPPPPSSSTGPSNAKKRLTEQMRLPNQR